MSEIAGIRDFSPKGALAGSCTEGYALPNFTRYLFFWGPGAGNPSESAVQQKIAHDCIIKRLYITLGTAPGGVASRTFTLRVNGGPTALTCTITGVATTGSDLVNEVRVNSGSDVCIEIVPAGGPVDSTARWGAMVQLI